MLKRKHRTKKAYKKEGMESKKEKRIINRVDNSSNFLLIKFVCGFFWFFLLIPLSSILFFLPCLHITLLLTNLPFGCVLLVDAFISSSSFRSISSNLSLVLSSSLFHLFRRSL